MLARECQAVNETEPKPSNSADEAGEAVKRLGVTAGVDDFFFDRIYTP